jgi:hypothetical protein
MAAASFTTELVASELVTNAIRYGTPPIRLARYHTGGKTIWCEQALCEGPGSLAIPLEAI